MDTAQQEQLGTYLSSYGAGACLQSMAGLSGLSLALLDSADKLLHHCEPELDTASDSSPTGGTSGPPLDPAHCPEGQTFLRMPLPHQGETIGFLHLCGTQNEEHLSRFGASIIQVVLEAINHEYEMDNLSSEILSKYEELNVLYDVGESLHINMNRQEICHLAVEKVQQVVGAGRTCILLRDSEGQTLQPIADSGYESGLAVDGSRDAVLLLADHVAEVGKALLVDGQESVPPDLWARIEEAGLDDDRLWPFLAAPIKRGDDLLGVLHTSDKPGGQLFTANDLKLVAAICSQAAVAISNLQMVNALKKTEALKREMEIARNIQMKMLPAAPIQLDTITVEGRCTTAANVGGDYFDHILIEESSGIDNDLIHLLIADVSGHDVGAALMMSIGRKVFQAAVRRNLEPSSLMREFNSLMHDDLSGSDLFITMFYAQYRHSTRTLRFANAGHNPPFLVRGADGTVEPIDADGMIIGVLEDLEFETGEIVLQPGDLAVFYTDGVVEAENQQAEQYDLERFHTLVQEHRTEVPKRLLDIIYDSVKDFSGGVDQYDDITVMILKDVSG
jgi:sigma-B regulation protein RsbU (phosphoserine phosphatase)